MLRHKRLYLHIIYIPYQQHVYSRQPFFLTMSVGIAAELHQKALVKKMRIRSAAYIEIVGCAIAATVGSGQSYRRS